MSDDQTKQPKAPPIQPFVKKERAKNTKSDHTKRWEDGSRKLMPEGKWVVSGANQETGATSKTLVRGESKANRYAEGIGKTVLKVQDDPKDPDGPKTLIIDHGYVANRRQRRASR